MNARRGAVLVTTALALAACRVGETRNEVVQTIAPTESATRTCASAFVPPDLSTLTPCGDGKGHCYDVAKQPIDPAQLTACAAPGQVCVPDKVLLANGTKLKPCLFMGGPLKGACASLLLSELNQHASEVTQDVCDADERCTPCDDPRTNENTGTCDATGVHAKDCTGGAGADDELCCHGAGVCMNNDAVPADSRGDLDRDSCSNSSQVCAPTAMSDGTPTKCSLLGLDGICLDTCFAQILAGTSPVTQSSCGPTEVCLPCVIGKGKGMPGCD